MSCMLDTVGTYRENLSNLEIFNAKQIRLTEEDIRSIAEIKCHPKVLEWGV